LADYLLQLVEVMPGGGNCSIGGEIMAAGETELCRRLDLGLEKKKKNASHRFASVSICIQVLR
jgi:hypothetical protein